MTTEAFVASLPPSIRVGPFDFTIVRESMFVAMGKRQWGDCSTAAQQITLQADFPTKIKAVDTLLHEVMHALYWAYGVEEGDKEERLVGVISTGLVALHRDNQWLAVWLQQAFV